MKRLDTNTSSCTPTIASSIIFVRGCSTSNVCIWKQRRFLRVPNKKVLGTHKKTSLESLWLYAHSSSFIGMSNWSLSIYAHTWGIHLNRFGKGKIMRLLSISWIVTSKQNQMINGFFLKWVVSVRRRTMEPPSKCTSC